MVAGTGFEPVTSWLWATRAAICSTLRCCASVLNVGLTSLRLRMCSALRAKVVTGANRVHPAYSVPGDLAKRSIAYAVFQACSNAGLSVRT